MLSNMISPKKHIANGGLKDARRQVCPLDTGACAEHLVCADLIFNGFNPFRTEQRSPFDIGVYHGGRTIRIQVKGTMTARECHNQAGYVGDFYMFSIVRYSFKKRERIIYTADDIDAFAFVALDRRVIGYVAASALAGKTIIHYPRDGVKLSECTMDNAFRDVSGPQFIMPRVYDAEEAEAQSSNTQNVLNLFSPE